MRLPPPASGTLSAETSTWARKTNYDFERRERERNKEAESARKAKAKAEKKSAEQGSPDSIETGEA
jgi:hypothetical protein